MNASMFASRRPTSFREAVTKLGPRRPVATHSRKHLAVWNAEVIRRRAQLCRFISRLSQSEFGTPFETPELPIVTADVAAGINGAPVEVMEESLRNFDGLLDQSLYASPFFGRVTFAGEHECTFTYFDSRIRHGIVQTSHEITRHEHHLVQVRIRKLDDRDVKLPRPQRRIVAMLPRDLGPMVRVVTGLLILKKEGDAGTVRHDHAFGRFLRKAGAAAVKYGPGAAVGAGAGAGIALGAAALFSAISSAASAAAVVAVADPALVLGDVVLTGWLEGVQQ